MAHKFRIDHRCQLNPCKLIEMPRDPLHDGTNAMQVADANLRRHLGLYVMINNRDTCWRAQHILRVGQASFKSHLFQLAC